MGYDFLDIKYSLNIYFIFYISFYDIRHKVALVTQTGLNYPWLLNKQNRLFLKRFYINQN